MTAYTIGVDIGGTKIAGGAVDEAGSIQVRARADTPHRSTSPDVVEDVIATVVARLVGEVGRDTVAAVGVGAAGFVSADRATVAFSPHLSWRNEPLRTALEQRVGLPTVVDNDANAAAWAEWKFGAGRGESHLVVVNLGTGIGGGVVVDGCLQRGRYGMAGEFGHMQVVPRGLLCECGNRGCWEQYASGNALVREARALIAAGSPMADDLRARAGADAAELTGPLVTEAARAGDRLASRAARRGRPVARCRHRQPRGGLGPWHRRRRRRGEPGRPDVAGPCPRYLPKPAHRARVPHRGTHRRGRAGQRRGPDRRRGPGSRTGDLTAYQR